MRRKDKEITDISGIESILRRALVCRLAMADHNRPYIVPLNFAYKDNCLYFHTGRQGQKIDCLRKNENVCFEVDEEVEIVSSGEACGWGVKYFSVIGFGRAVMIDDPQDKIQALNVIMEKYSGTSGWDYPLNNLDRTLVIKVLIDRLTGKKSGY